jgi:hypothetical protein
MVTQPRPASDRLRRGQEVLTSVGPVVLAFLASQHHTLHMLLLSLGMGTAGMSFMAMYPDIRRGMLAISLLAAGLAAYQVSRRGRPRWMRLGQLLSAIGTLLLVGWSLIRFGL